VIPEERLRRYAELAVRVGANVQPDQDVVVTGLVEHAEIARVVAREAYRAGARHVVMVGAPPDEGLRLGKARELGFPTVLNVGKDNVAEAVTDPPLPGSPVQS